MERGDEVNSISILTTYKASPFDWEEPLKSDNQKLFPFYFMTNFYVNLQSKVNPERYTKCPELVCDYCGEVVNYPNNGAYWTAYVVLESSVVIKNICNPYHCKNRPAGLMDYQHQLYGVREPLQLPERFHKSNAHCLIFSKLCRFSRGFWLKACTHGINLNDYKERLAFIGGGTLDFPGFDGWYDLSASGIKLMDNDFKVVLKLSPPEIVKVINEIIRNQREEQLMLW